MLRCTPAEYAEAQVARLAALGCSAEYLERIRAGITAHTQPGPPHPYGKVWLRPDEQPTAERYTETAHVRESHGYV